MGLDSALEWYLPIVEKQMGVAIAYERSGEGTPVNGTVGIHVYRVAQEALNNVARHSGATSTAWPSRSRTAEGAFQPSPAAGSGSSPCASARICSAARSSS